MNVRLRARIVGGGYGAPPFTVVNYGDATSDIANLQAAITTYGAIYSVPLAAMTPPVPPSPVISSATLANLAACFNDAAKRLPSAKSATGYTYAILAGFTAQSVSDNIGSLTDALNSLSGQAASIAAGTATTASTTIPGAISSSSQPPASTVPWGWVAAGVGAVVVIGGAALLARRNRAA